MNRRHFLATTAGAALSTTLALALPPAPLLKGQADHVISIWLGGGMGQVDTFDPKRRGDPVKKIAGSYYDSIATAVPGVSVCEHLPNLAPLMDRVTAVRSVHHEVIDEHAAATNRMHTGRVVSGTVVYPSLGSTIAHERARARCRGGRRTAVRAHRLPKCHARPRLPRRTRWLPLPHGHEPGTGRTFTS